jgi:hypothetical protein
MADIEQALHAYVTADATVGGLIGSRMYPQILPQGVTYPCLRYQRVSGPRDYTHNGASGWVRGRVQFDAYAPTYAGAKALFNAVRSRLSGFKGTMATVTVGSCLLLNEMDAWEEEPEPNIYRLPFDFMIQYTED